VSYLGRLDPSKNVKLLIEAFIDFKKDNLNSKLTLSIAGSGKESTEIESICSNYNFLNFKGGLSYDKVDDFLSNTDYTIIPSVTDNLPTVGIESLMNSTPIIISSNTGLSEYCTNNVNSIVFFPKKENLIKIFEKISKYKNQEMRVESRKLFKKKFSIENYCKNIEDLLNSK
jgi:glycosyltransferase involved in cell wall biosynthesis